MTTRKYDKTRLDLQYKKSNETLEFYISDTDTSDFYIRLTRANMPIKVDDLIIVLCAIDPSNQVRSQFISADTNKEGFVYCKLDDSMKSQVGTYQAKVMLVYKDEKIVTDTFTYTVKNDMFVALSQEIISDERFQTLNDMLSGFSQIKLDEEQRKVNESNRQSEIVEMKGDIDTLISITDEYVEQHIGGIETDVNNLITDTTQSINDSIDANTTFVNKMISDGNETLDNIRINSANSIQSVSDYKETKDIEIDDILTTYTNNATQTISSYISEKDNELDNLFETYELDTTTAINLYKSNKNAEIDLYKNTKDSEIDLYKSNKDIEIDTYINSKNSEISNFLNEKTTELDNYQKKKNVELDEYKNEINMEIDTYKSTKDEQINTFVTSKNNEITNAEKTRVANESRRDTNEYARGLNETTRKNNETNRTNEFNDMKTQFKNMIKFNEYGELVVTINGVSKIFTPK